MKKALPLATLFSLFSAVPVALIILLFMGLSASGLSAQCSGSVDAGPDIYACMPPSPATVQLNATVPPNTVSFMWSPGLLNVLNPTFQVNAPVSTYIIKASYPNGANLIVNGDFEQGNTGFTSGFVYSPSDLSLPDTYDVLRNPQDDNPVYSDCPDHTTGTGNMLALYPDPATLDIAAWCQTVTVEPNTKYYLSFFYNKISPLGNNTNRFGLLMDGILVANAGSEIFSNNTCKWYPAAAFWTSGSNTSVEFCIIEFATPQSPTKFVGPFAIDDIVMRALCTVQDTVKVYVKPLTIAPSANLTVPCAGSPITINATNGSSTGNFISYEWSTPNGNIASGANTLTPTINQPGNYWLDLKFQSSTHTCDLKTGFVVKEGPTLLVNILQTKPLTCFGSTISLKALPNFPSDLTYAWSAGGGGNIVSGSNTATPIINQPGLYKVLITNTKNGCTATSEYEVQPPPPPPLARATATPITCSQPQATLSGTGSSPAMLYTWTTLDGTIATDPKKITATATAPGTYVLEAFNTATGCKGYDTVQVVASLTKPALAIAPPAILACGKPDTVALSAAVTPPSALLSWAASGGGNIVSGSSSAAPKVDASGAYTLTATDPANGCTAAASVSVLSAVNLNALIAPPDTLTCARPALVLSAAGSSAGPGIVYAWTTPDGIIQSGGGTLAPVVTAPGAYTLTVRDTASGCDKKLDINVFAEKAAPQAQAAPAPNLNCSLPAAALSAVRLDTLPNIAIEWTTANGQLLAGATSLTPTVGSGGAYHLLLTNLDNGCTATLAVPVTADFQPPAVQIAPAPALTCTVTSLALSAAATSASGQLTYDWAANGGGNIASGGTTAAPNIDRPGAYALTVTDPANGCTASASTTVALDNTPPAVQIAPAPALTCTVTSLALSAAATSASGQLTYDWAANGGGNISSGGTTAAPNIDRPGAYALTVTDPANGCTASAAMSISENKTPPAADAGADQTLTCGKPAAALNGTASAASGNFIYSWTTAGGNFAAGQNTLAPTVDAPGAYTLLVTDTQNGCTATNQALVLKDANVPTAIAQMPGVLDCKTASVQLSATGASQGPGFSYAWTTADGNILSGENTLAPIVNKPGAYTLSVFSAASQCTATATVIVIESRQSPAIHIKPPLTLTCAATSLALDASGSAQGSLYAYAWQASGGGHIASDADGLAPTVDQPGIYTLLITDAHNGCTAAAAITVTQNIAPPTAEAGPGGRITCASATIALSGAGSSTGGNFVYQWSTTGGNFTAGQNSLAPTVNQPGAYTLLVTDTQNSCTATDQTTVEKDANALLALTQTPGALTCKTTALQLSATGTSQGAGFTYLWTTASGHFVAGENTLTPIVNQPGQYTLQVSDPTNGCTAAATITVTEDKAPPVAKAAAPAALDCNSPVVSLDGSGSSTGPDFTYAWTTASGHFVAGKSTLAPTVDQPGVYDLLITNTLNGCTEQASAVVSRDVQPPVAWVAPPGLLTCAAASLSLDGSGSSAGPDFTYAWTTASGHFVAGKNTLAPTVDQPGVYDLLITNTLNGCSAQASAVVSRDVQPPVAWIAPPGLLTCAAASLSLNGSGSSAGPDFTYAWTTASGHFVAGKNTLAPVVDQPGIYNLLITNTLNGCTATASANVGQDTGLPQVDAGASKTLLCSAPVVTITGAVTGAGSSFEISWTTLDGQILSGANTLSPSVGAAGTYTLWVKNLQNGCSQSDVVTVLKDQNAPLSAAAVSGGLTCKVTQLVLSGAGSSTGQQFAYSWATAWGSITSGSSTLNPTVSKPGVYELLVTNTANGCTATATVTVSENKTPPQATATAGGTLSCKAAEVSLSGSSPANVTYAWSGPGIVSGSGTPSPAVQTAGAYALLVTDLDNGCTGTATVQVLENKIPPEVAIAPPAQLNCLILTTQLNGAGSSLGSDFAYSWAGAGLLSGSTTLQPTVNQAGIYTLNVVNQANGCTASATTTVAQDVQLPTAQAGGGFELNCTMQSGSLTAAGSSSGPQFAYSWSGAAIVSGGGTAAPTVSEPGLYALTVRNTANGCTATASVLVTQNPSQPTGIKRTFSPPDCKGRPGSIRFEEVLGGTAPYTYSIDGGMTLGAVQQFEKLPPGTYALLVQDANGCEYAESLTLTAPVHPQVSIQPEVQLNFGEKKTLTAALNIPLGEVDTIIWSPLEGLERTAEPNVVVAQGLRFTHYEVRVVNKEGCEDRALFEVRVDKPHIWAPNVFSPRRPDGQNDHFLIFAAEGAVRSIRTLQIFDRWGSMVFRNDDLLPNVEKMGWDGRFREVAVQPAVFVWYAEVLLANGETIIIKGDVTVVE